MTDRRAFLLGAVLVACSKASRDGGGRTSGRRIVSLSPSTTEAIFAVGAGAQLVGRSRYCDWPKEVEKLPQVGGYVDPSYEAILALRPDLVVGARGPAGAAIAERLEARGISTFFPQTETFAQIDEMILGIGQRTDRAAEAKAFVDTMNDRIRAIEARVAALPKVRVLLVFGLEPISVAGPGGFPDEMIRKAGGTNVITSGGTYPTLNIERVLTLDPEVVINAAMAERDSAQRMNKDAPGWSRVRAIREGRLVKIDEESILRPGPRIGEGIEILAKAIHP
jgi:iron complex transport system substrate-binding protein